MRGRRLSTVRGSVLLLILCSAVFGGCGDTGRIPDGDADRDGTQLKSFAAMTFNLRTGMAADGDDAWSRRKEMVCRLIAARLPAVLGVQEAWKFQVEYIIETVPGYSWVGVSRSDAEYDEYCAVLYRSDLFTLRESGTFWLSETPDVPLSTFGPAQNYPRIVTWATLESRAGGRILNVFNTHFDTTSHDEIPERSAALLVQRIALTTVADDGVVVLGDFNQTVDSATFRILTGAQDYLGVHGELLDPWILLGLHEEGTFHGFSGVARHASRIDWILHSTALTPILGEVIHDQEDGRYPSDHFPVMVEFGWTD